MGGLVWRVQQDFTGSWHVWAETQGLCRVTSTWASTGAVAFREGASQEKQGGLLDFSDAGSEPKQYLFWPWIQGGGESNFTS